MQSWKRIQVNGQRTTTSLNMILQFTPRVELKVEVLVYVSSTRFSLSFPLPLLAKVNYTRGAHCNNNLKMLEYEETKVAQTTSSQVT